MSGKPGDELVAYLVDALAPLAAQPRRFFGGHALVARGVQFAFVSDGTVYLRTDLALAAELESLGSEPFRYKTKLREVRVASYWSLPGTELDDPEVLVGWAKRALRGLEEERPRRQAKQHARRRLDQGR